MTLTFRLKLKWKGYFREGSKGNYIAKVIKNQQKNVAFLNKKII